MRQTKFAAISVLGTIVALLSASSARCEERAVLELHSGVELRGSIDGRSDMETIWLRSGTRSTGLLRAVHWEDIRAAYLDGQSVAVESLRTRVPTTDHPSGCAGTAEQAPDVVSSGTQDAASGGGQQGSSEPFEPLSRRASRALGFSPRIARVLFDVRLANWSGASVPNGVELQLVAVSATGERLECDGTLTVDLAVAGGAAIRPGDVTPTSDGSTGENGGTSFGAAGLSSDAISQRWVVSVPPGLADRNGQVVRLPFNGSRAPSALSGKVRGAVRVRLDVPGQGMVSGLPFRLMRSHGGADAPCLDNDGNG